MRYIAFLLTILILHTANATDTSPLDRVNTDFHQAYDARVSDIIKTFGAIGGRPVLMDLGGNLVFLHDGKKQTYNVTPGAYHKLKDFGHASFAVYLILAQHQGKLTPFQVTALQALKNDLTAAQQILLNSKLSSDQTNNANRLANITLQFINEILQTNLNDSKSLKKYYAATRPMIELLFNQGSEIELKSLDTTIKSWMKELTPKERKKLGVVIATSHQARNQEVSLQYFAKTFGFHYGFGAQAENGYILMENNFDEAAGLSMLARHYLDREAGEMIFNRVDRLQTDILADGAKKYLQHM